MLITLLLADRSIKDPWEVDENMLIKDGNFIFSIDFIVLDIGENQDMSVILRRPFPNNWSCFNDFWNLWDNLESGK